MPSLAIVQQGNPFELELDVTGQILSDGPLLLDEAGSYSLTAIPGGGYVSVEDRSGSATIRWHLADRSQYSVWNLPFANAHNLRLSVISAGTYVISREDARSDLPNRVMLRHFACTE